MAEKGMDYALGFVLKLAEAGRTFDEARSFVLEKSAYGGSGEWYPATGRNAAPSEPMLSRRTYDRIYAGTRKRLLREADRASSGDRAIVFQGFRNPVTGGFRFPFSIGSRKSNIVNSTMTPAQANLVALLTKHKRLKGYRQVARKLRNGSPDFEFMRDPTIFNSHANRLTRRGMEDLRKAYRHVHGVTPDDYVLGTLAGRLFGTNSGFDGNPVVFDRIQGRMI